MGEHPGYCSRAYWRIGAGLPGILPRTRRHRTGTLSVLTWCRAR